MACSTISPPHTHTPPCHALQLGVLSPESFPAEARCQAAVVFWRILLGLLLPAVLLARPPAEAPLLTDEGHASRRGSPSEHAHQGRRDGLVTRLSSPLEEVLGTLRLPRPDLRLPPEPLPMRALLAVPWLLRRQLLLSLLWSLTLLPYRPS